MPKGIKGWPKSARPRPVAGDRFGYWTVLCETPNPNRLQRPACRVRCRCGAERVVTVHVLQSGRSGSCGCRIGELNRQRTVPVVHVGERFGRLVVTGPAESHPGRRKWSVLCDCGITKSVLQTGLRAGDVQSCGCYATDVLRLRSVKHARTRTPEYTVWQNMLGRCRRADDAKYINYGGRGIAVWNGWQRFLVHDDRGA